MKDLIVLVLPIFLLMGCRGENEKDVLFEMSYRVEFEIPAGLNTVEDHFFPFRDIDSTLDSLLVFHGYSREDISTVNPKTARLTSIFDGDNYDFIHEFSLYLFNEETNDLSHEAFWRTEIPLNTRDVLDIPGTLLDGTAFFLEPKFNAELRFDTRLITTTFTSTQAEFTFVIRGK